MTAKELLYQVRALGLEINQINSHIEGLYELTGVVYTDLPKGENKNDLSDKVASIIELREMWNKKVERFVDLKALAIKLLLQVDNPMYRQVLTMRYLDLKGWDEMATILGYNLNYLYNAHGRALKVLKNLNGIVFV